MTDPRTSLPASRVAAPNRGTADGLANAITCYWAFIVFVTWAVALQLPIAWSNFFYYEEAVQTGHAHLMPHAGLIRLAVVLAGLALGRLGSRGIIRRNVETYQVID